jgi:hypothetical protein
MMGHAGGAVPRRGMPVVFGVAVQPSGVVGVLVQAGAVGTFVGTLIAYRRRRRDAHFDTFPIITRWSVVGLLGGAVYLLLSAIR